MCESASDDNGRIRFLAPFLVSLFRLSTWFPFVNLNSNDLFFFFVCGLFTHFSASILIVRSVFFYYFFLQPAEAAATVSVFVCRMYVYIFVVVEMNIIVAVVCVWVIHLWCANHCARRETFDVRKMATTPANWRFTACTILHMWRGLCHRYKFKTNETVEFNFFRQQMTLLPSRVKWINFQFSIEGRTSDFIENWNERNRFCYFILNGIIGGVLNLKCVKPNRALYNAHQNFIITINVPEKCHGAITWGLQNCVPRIIIYAIKETKTAKTHSNRWWCNDSNQTVVNLNKCITIKMIQMTYGFRLHALCYGRYTAP